MMKYKVEEPKGFGPTWVNVIGENNKKETMVIELIHCKNPGGENSLPYLWNKAGYTDHVMETYISCNTYVTDSEGACRGAYNPLSKGNCTIDFEWMFEDTEKNQRKIIEECIRRFEAATGESATEIKMEHIKDCATERKLKVVHEIPKGWRQNPKMVDPLGAVTIDNGKAVFKYMDGKYRKNPEHEEMLLVI